MSGMRLSTIEIARLLPSFMRDDLAVKGLSAGVNQIVRSLSADVVKLSTWDRIDTLSETELDELAWELNILWYNKSASIDTKRELVKNSDKVYQHLGTKWAVENVIRSYFGDGYITEWFEYDGEPGCFRVVSANPTLNNEKLQEFLNILGKVKRASSHLDGITITLSAELELYAGVAIHDVSHEAYTAR